MNTTNLRTFVAVMELGSISAAAKRLHLTQPAISKRIQNLEEEFDVVLFDAIGRGIKPTAAAIALLEHARHWLDEYEEVKRSMSAQKQSVAGKLTIGTSHHIGLHHLAPLLKDFVQAYPEVSLDVRFVDSESAHAEVSSGDLNLAFITLPPAGLTLSNDKLSYQKLWDDELVFVAATFSALAHNKGLTLKQLTEYSAILPAAHTFTSHIVLDVFATHELKPKATMSTNPLESIRMLASIGLGWSVLPRSLVTDELCELHIKDAPSMQRSLGLVTHPARTLGAAGRALYDIVLASV